MSFSTWFNDLKAKASNNWAQFKNAAFKEATMAMCARMAAANGKIDDGEKQAVADVIGGIPELAAYDPTALYGIFEKHADALNKSPIGKVAADRAISGIKGKAELCAAAVQICLMIANADGTFEESEKKVLKEVCAVLGVDPTPYLPS
ncbi:MAG: TerB family tellurite resistance protein [Candidatus Obscuribacterales bacterium]|nr:TerB family tellurite resistance protein [Candidatus Obscuribacterales bacterium]